MARLRDLRMLPAWRAGRPRTAAGTAALLVRRASWWGGAREILLGDEVGEGGGFAEVDAEGAFGADVGEGYFERVRRRGYLVGLDGGAGYVLFLVVGGAGGDVLVDGEGPLVFAGDRINAKGADRDCGVAEGQRRFGEEDHWSAAGRPGFSVGNSFALAADWGVVDADLASVVEITGGGGRIRGLLG